MRGRVGGNNNLKPEVVARIDELTRQSVTLRGIQAATGAHKDTIVRHQKLLGLDKLNCACGRSLRHRGFCSVRYARSAGRQEFMRRWHGGTEQFTTEVDETFCGDTNGH